MTLKSQIANSFVNDVEVDDYNRYKVGLSQTAYVPADREVHDMLRLACLIIVFLTLNHARFRRKIHPCFSVRGDTPHSFKVGRVTLKKV